MGFREELEIDPNELDREWLAQPKKFYQVSEELAEARKELDRLKLKADVLEAETDARAREEPEEFGLVKITETTVKNAVTSDREVQKARSAIIEAKHEVDVLSAAVSALDQRKRALENLVTLHGQSYFSTPSVRNLEPQARTAAAEKIEETGKKAARSRGRKKK